MHDPTPWMSIPLLQHSLNKDIQGSAFTVHARILTMMIPYGLRAPHNLGLSTLSPTALCLTEKTPT